MKNILFFLFFMTFDCLMALFVVRRGRDNAKNHKDCEC